MLLFRVPSHNVFSEYSKNSFGASKLSSLCKCSYITAPSRRSRAFRAEKSHNGKATFNFFKEVFNRIPFAFALFICLVSSSVHLWDGLAAVRRAWMMFILCCFVSKEYKLDKSSKGSGKQTPISFSIYPLSIMSLPPWIYCTFLHVSSYWLSHQLKKLKINSAHYLSLLPEH